MQRASAFYGAGRYPCLLRAARESCGSSCDIGVLCATEAENQCLLLDQQGARAGACRMTITIYHNPNCGTSRNTLAMIRNSGVEPIIIEYLKTPPTRPELVDLIRRMGITVRALLREKGTPYAELRLDDAGLSDDQLVDAMMANPILINRPIVVTPLGVKLCRPSEAVLDILPDPQRGAFVKEDGEKVVSASGQPLG